MKTRASLLALLLCAVAGAGAARASDDFLDRVDDALTVSAFEDSFRARLSGSVDLEQYHFQQPAPGLINTAGHDLFNPRLAVFLDAQFRSHLYAFVQTRVDRGFDPHDDGAQVRLDEYALRFTPGDTAHFNLQVGKFATSVGSWVPRHGSWDNPFVTAPLPYENLTGIWDLEAVPSDLVLLQWAHVRPGLPARITAVEKGRRVPIIWGPAYATGAAVSGVFDRMSYVLEVKNASLSARPEDWNSVAVGLRHPTFSGRLGYAPDESWNLGLSASVGPYLRPLAEAEPTVGGRFESYREIVLGQDVSFAWHHLQLWTEFFGTRFAIPRVGNADTFAWYTEAKYKFTPQFFGAVRWNQQLFSAVPDGSGGRAPWGMETWRIDVAPGYRFTPHTQFKLQYSLQDEKASPRRIAHTLATQFTVRF
ncbi:MAG TPA: hypothetical protein VG838_00155 [Opitutaceae bacterium]|nr:hypothetical protein [Opitutaceae bacterium]